VVIPYGDCLSHPGGAPLDSADADSTHIFVVVDGGDQHLQGSVLVPLGRLNVVDDGIEQGGQILALLVLAQRGGAGSAGAEQDGAFKLFIVGVKLQQ